MGDGGQPALLNFLKGKCPLDFPMGAILHFESNGKDACILFWARRNPVYFWGREVVIEVVVKLVPCWLLQNTPRSLKRGETQKMPANSTLKRFAPT